ncbi:MAG: hypothetical protein EPN43_05445, partial [Jatrophihabitans sp.]
MSTTTEAVAEPTVPRPHPIRAARLAFRGWRRTRPFWAGVWTMLGGTIIAYVPGTAFKLMLVANSSLVIGVVVGIVIAAFGLMLWFLRPLRIPLGVLILLLSLASFFTSDFGGLLLGMVLALVGGSLAIAWVPAKVTWRERRRIRALSRMQPPAARDGGAGAPPPPDGPEGMP